MYIENKKVLLKKKYSKNKNMCRICIRSAEDPQTQNSVQLFDQNQHGGGGQNLPLLFNKEDYSMAPQDFSAKSTGYVKSMLKLFIIISQ